MEGQGSKKRPVSETKGMKGSKRLNQELKEVESSDSSLSNSPVSSSSSDLVDADNETSSSSWSSCDDDETNGERQETNEPWLAPINSETKKLCFMPVDPEGKNHMEKLDEYSRQGKLENLKCIDIDLTQIIEDYDEENDKVAEILNRILLASVDTVEEIILRNPIGYLPVVFPVMEKVVKLKLDFYWFGTDTTNFQSYLRGGEIFPKGFKLSTMPTLEEVIIQLQTEEQIRYRFDCWKNNLKSVGISKTVKKIQYSDACGFSRKQLKTSFPKASWTK